MARRSDGPRPADATQGPDASAPPFAPGNSRLAFKAEAHSASSPLAAAFLLGLSVPKQHADRLADLIMSGRAPVPVEGIAGDDGSRAWEWDADGVFIVLRSFDDGRSDAYCEAQRVQEGKGCDG